MAGITGNVVSGNRAASGADAAAGAFGESIVAMLEPRVQIDAIYGIQTKDHETYTNGTGAAATAAAGLFVATSGTDVGGYGTVRSRRICHYRPGQGLRARFTAAFDEGVASYLSGAGAFNATDGLWFGYNGADFGITRRIAGSHEIRTLTITGAATGGGTIVVTLNDTAFNVTVGGALTTAEVAETIAQTTFTGWRVTAADSVVTFQAESVAAMAGAFSFAAGTTGATATGPTQVVAGAANDQDTYFVAQADWNVAPAFDIDPAKLNVYQILIPYLGAGPIAFQVMNGATGLFETVHRVDYPNNFTVPSAKNPSYRVGWFSASLGSTTSKTVKGASGALFNEGPRQALRDPDAVARTATSVTSEVSVLAIRAANVFSATINQREIEPLIVSAGLEGSKPGVVRVYLGGTLSGLPAWTAADGTSVESEQTNGLTLTGGSLIAAKALAGGGEAEIRLHEFGVRLQAGEMLVVTAEVQSGAGSNVSVSASWLES